ncbi:type IX secretion system protein PorG [Nonlabens agnitus]|uniref:DUF6089 domain-containing protein n=1 Tax=Nonlabens agnitus TaxID=870484 RepID=A0A2S9WWS2_9FLAO|nr:DUF6089 family protein [Nonlabens agnitus]PRP67915.1 hypothetical protein BST86_12830 [Nonlabens agnitus]
MRLVLLLIAFFVFAFAKAQTYELGVWAGGSNVIGDVGSTKYVNPSGIAIGGVAKWNRSNRHSFRGSLIYTRLNGDDSKSDDRSRELRGLEYEYSMLEASLGVEYTFWEWELYSGKRHITPYMYTGFSTYSYGSLALNENTNNNQLERYSRRIDFAIPFILGVKTNLTEHLILAAEIGARYTFTDNLDGSNPDESKDEFEELKFGNLNNNDWYVFSGVTITYTFGRKPCYCNF